MSCAIRHKEMRAFDQRFVNVRGRHKSEVTGMARQSWRERRGDQDEKRQPYQIIDRAEPAPTQARSNSAAL